MLLKKEVRTLFKMLLIISFLFHQIAKILLFSVFLLKFFFFLEGKHFLATYALRIKIFSQSETGKPPYMVLLATSDANFIKTIKRLHKDDIVVLLACPYNGDESLRSAVLVKWW